MKAEAIRVKGEDGEVHIQPPHGSFDPLQTMCTILEAEKLTPTNDPVDCGICLINLATLKDGIKLVKI